MMRFHKREEMSEKERGSKRLFKILPEVSSRHMLLG